MKNLIEILNDLTVNDNKKQADGLAVAIKELLFQNEEKEKRAVELAIANKELLFQYEEKEKRAVELAIANKKLLFENEEKEKRADELAIANKEKEERADELVIADKNLSIAAKKLAESQALIATVLENVAACIYLKDTTGHYIFVNPKCSVSWDMPIEKIIGATDDDLFDKNSAAIIREHDRRILVDGEIIEREEIATTVKWVKQRPTGRSKFLYVTLMEPLPVTLTNAACTCTDNNSVDNKIRIFFITFSFIEKVVQPSLIAH